MRNIYIAVTAFFILSLLLFIASFLYLDKEKHRIYHYTVNLDGHDVGTIRIDKFETDAKLIYKSVATIPLSDLFTGSKSRIDLDRKYRLESYSSERYGAGAAAESLYLENKDGLVSFISKYNSKFAFLDNIPVKKDILIFEEDSPVTYLPIIENYNFREGHSQGFNAITCFSDPSLPPMRRFVTLTSIKDEYLKVGGRKIKTENLLLKIRNYPQGSVWVAKSDKRLIKLEIPKLGLTITRSFRPKNIEAKDYLVSPEGYAAKEISFKNKNIQFAGTLTIPNKEGRYPAALLIWPDGAQRRDYHGLFASLADYLSKNGFCVLRFDKRGIDASGGDMAVTTAADEIEDLNAAIVYLAGQKEVDPQNIVLIAHSKGALPALKIASQANNIRAVVLMSPSIYLGPDKGNGRLEELKRLASKFKWSEKYLALAIRCFEETANKAKSSNRRWAYIMGKRCFLKAVREDLEERPLEVVNKVRVPVLILQGKLDEEVGPETAPALDRALGENGNPNHTLVYFGYLGHILGTKVSDGIHKLRCKIDKDVLSSMKNWLDKVSARAQ